MSLRRRLVLLLPPAGGGSGPTTATLTGPSTGSTGSASSNFTVTLDSAATSTVTVAPAGTNGTVTFTPSSPTIGVGQTSVTFTATPALDGLHAISITTSPTLTISGSPVNYTTSTADTTPPVLSSPVGTATGSTTATVGATTDEGNGTLYAVVTTSATQPTVAQIKAGQNHAGASASWSGSQVIGSTGAKTFGATGLAASTVYYAHLVHSDAASNDSNRISSSSFTTSAGGTITSEPLKDNTGTVLANTALAYYSIHNDTTSALVLRKTGLSTDASGVVTFSDAAVVAGTMYRHDWETVTGTRRMPRKAAT